MVNTMMVTDVLSVTKMMVNMMTVTDVLLVTEMVVTDLCVVGNEDDGNWYVVGNWDDSKYDKSNLTDLANEDQ